MSLSKKIAYNTLIQILSKFIATAFGLVAIAIITRYLGQAGFGQYTTIITFVSFFAITADLGITLVTVQMISRPETDQNKILSNLFGLRLVSAIIFLGIAPLLVLWLPYDPIIKLGVAVITFSFLFNALNQVLVGLFQKNLRLDKVAIAEVASRLFLVVGVTIAVAFNYGLIGILVATVLANAVSFSLHYLFSRKFAQIKLSFSLTIWAEVIKKTWPLALTIIFNLIYLKADTLILSLIKSQAEVGIYGAAYKVIDVIVTLPFIFAGIVLPLLVKNWFVDKASFSRVMQKSFDFMVILALPLVVGTQFVATRIMAIVAGKEFAISGPALRLLILAAGIIYLGSVFTHGIIAIDKQKKVIAAYLFTALTALAGYLIFIPRYSYFGAAWVTIYSELAVALTSVYLIRKYSGFFPDLAVFFKSALASSVMAAILYYFSNLNLIIILLLAPLSYFVVLFLLGGIVKKDLLIFSNKT